MRRLGERPSLRFCPVLSTFEDRSVPAAFPIPTSAALIAPDDGGSPSVKVVNPVTGENFGEIVAYENTFRGGVHAALGDVNGDGVNDIVLAPGIGGGPRIRIVDGKSGETLSDTFVYESTYTGGVYVATGDVNGDGKADIITGTGIGGGPRIRVLDGATLGAKVLKDFFAYESSFRGGVLVAAGDVNGDGMVDIIAGTGVGGGPRAIVFDAKDNTVLRDFFAFDSSFRGGVRVGGGDLNGDGYDDILVGAGQGGDPRVRAMSGKDLSELGNFLADDTTFHGGVYVDSVPDNSSDHDNLLVRTRHGNDDRVQLFDGKSLALGQPVAVTPVAVTPVNDRPESSEPHMNAITNRIPAEWERHDSTWLQWPKGEESSYRDNFAGIIQSLQRFERVHLAVESSAARTEAIQFLQQKGVPLDNVQFDIMPYDWSWMRDNGAIWVEQTDAQGVKKLAVQDWGFDGWGGYGGPSVKDDAVPQYVATIENVGYESVPVVLEKGTLEFNGKNTLITSWPVLHDRNPNMTRDQLETVLKSKFGVTKVVWLEAKPSGDITNGHVDGIARFIDESTVVVSRYLDQTDPDAAAFEQSAEIIRAAGFKVVRLDIPGYVTYRGEELPANYTNYLVANGAVIASSYANAEFDNRARQQLQALFPGREIILTDTRELWYNGGSVHCVTNDQPLKP